MKKSESRAVKEAVLMDMTSSVIKAQGLGEDFPVLQLTGNHRSESQQQWGSKSLLTACPGGACIKRKWGWTVPQGVSRKTAGLETRGMLVQAWNSSSWEVDRRNKFKTSLVCISRSRLGKKGVRILR